MTAGSFSEDYVCDECGMAYRDYGTDDVAPAVRSFAPRWRELVSRVDEGALRRRPDEDTWSALQYGWHLGSGLGWMADTLESMTAGDADSFDWFGHEGDVRDADPDRRDLDEITTRIDGASARLAVVLAQADRGSWSRTADFPWGERDALDMARNAVHEGEHHLHDVRQVLDG